MKQWLKFSPWAVVWLASLLPKLVEDGNHVTVIDLKIPDEITNHENILPLEGDVFELIDSISKSQIIVNMLPGRIGDKVRPKLIQNGHKIVDLAFTLEI